MLTLLESVTIRRSVAFFYLYIYLGVHYFFNFILWRIIYYIRKFIKTLMLYIFGYGYII